MKSLTLQGLCQTGPQQGWKRGQQDLGPCASDLPAPAFPGLTNAPHQACSHQFLGLNLGPHDFMVSILLTESSLQLQSF